jgi:hypothetical protein
MLTQIERITTGDQKPLWEAASESLVIGWQNLRIQTFW